VILKGVFCLVTVVKKANESPEELLRRFRKKVIRSRILSYVRQKRWHVPKSEQRRIAKKKAVRRSRRKQRR
jgi:small subunit ribosomal protein S21